MKFKVFSDLEYEVKIPTTFIFNILVSNSANQSILEESIKIDPEYKLEEFTANDRETRFLRLRVKEKNRYRLTYEAVVDIDYEIVDEKKYLKTVPVSRLDAGVIPYLFPSRYCQSDKMHKLASKMFGEIENVYSRVLAINNWIYDNVEYLSGSTNASTSALDTLTERTGVCRDFSHLGIALCRALSIPARYFTGYAHELKPPDFHACFEAFIGGDWIIFDPTKLVPLNGLVKIANGRDAADASFASIFGYTTCTKIDVRCEAMDPNFKPYDYDKRNPRGLSYK